MYNLLIIKPLKSLWTQFLPIYSYSFLNFKLRYSCFPLRFKWGGWEGRKQGFLYAPFGELMYEHDPLWQNNRVPKYSFNAKELDEENGMYYYSARYYAPPTFISRDPMFEKYPSISPYTYCKNNPVKLIDPDGKAPGPGDPPKNNTLPKPQIKTSPRFMRIGEGLNNMFSGALTATFGVVYGSTTEGLGYFLGGSALVSLGGYKFNKGLQQFNNAVAGVDPNNDPKYVTPVGDATDNKILDNITDVAIGLPTPKNVPKTLKTINTLNTIYSAKNLIQSIDESKPNAESSSKPTLEIKTEVIYQDNTRVNKSPISVTLDQ
ncbi:MAG: RHS repeat-associated core domain-containing protein [Bacteroidales bacterium]